jgi:transcription elongation factor Elf1
MSHYHFYLVCPRCNKTSETDADKKIPHPSVNCGDCLMDHVEMVEMKVLAVEERIP